MKALQKEIVTEMKVEANMDVQVEVRRSVDFLKSYLRAHPFLKGYVLGISGGQDSTLTGKLAQLAVDELNAEGGTYQFVAMRLPYGMQADEDDCQDALAFIKPSDVLKVDIKSSVDASVAAVEQALGAPTSDFNKGNVKARHRMEVQYHVGATYGLAVLGTDHSAEAVTGFFTKYGDGGADVCPIFRLNKRQGKRLLAALGCPEHLYLKTPTADLEDDKPGLADEVALGVTYDEIDDYLEGKAVNEAAAEQIEAWYTKSRHKRNLPVTVFDEWWKS
ncbi:MAG: ammonia-dependent NAD(+) synthetase [Defluviitaleaceae bacterium]|nr:ammonia-dependent NAD(+) synthetase [Defluviitaleaceae bacterium]